ncbi:MAG: nucleoside hydrolase [Candidatus Geothermincolia bacterium]
MPPARVIIDTDPAIGIPFRDVDDALAILYLLSLPEEFEVAGITPVAGNAPLRKAEPIAREVLRAANREDVPVLAGASGRRELGKPTPASQFLSQVASEHPGEVTVLAIGPLTNVATAGIRDPDFYGNLARLVVMGGALEAGYGLPLVSPLEFNFWKDTEAACAVLAADCEKVILTMDLCIQVVFGRRELDAVYSMSSPAARYLSRHLGHWYRVNHLAPSPWKGGFVPWDMIAAVYMRRPELFEESETCLRLRKGRWKTGGLESCEDGSRPCRLPLRVSAPELLDEFLDTIRLE